MISTRAEVLKKLLDYNGDLPTIIASLRQFKWDSTQALVELKGKDICSVLNKYIHSKLTAENIEDWANALEGRDDIEFEVRYKKVITEAIHELANPLLTHPLSHQTAQKWIQKFKP